MSKQGQRSPCSRWLPSRKGCAAIFWLGLVSVGCQLPNQLTTKVTGTQYERANIVYELDGAQRPLPLTDGEIKPASFSDAEAAAPIAPEWAAATLTLQYPHPEGDADTARATLRLSAEPPRNSPSALAKATRWLGLSKAGESAEGHEDAAPVQPTRDDEIWVLDIPKQQLDLLVTDLQQNGFFQAQTRSQSGTKLDVQINWGRVQKEWSSEPRLDHFMSRVYREGRLEGLVARETQAGHPHVLAGR